MTLTTAAPKTEIRVVDVRPGDHDRALPVLTLALPGVRLARGDYQRAVLAGRRRWSGADLRGRARRWGARYSASRAALFGRLADALPGVRYGIVDSRTGRTGLVYRGAELHVLSALGGM